MAIFLETKRLIITTPQMSDFDDLHSLLSNPEVMRYISDSVYGHEETQDSLIKAVHHYEKHGFSLGSVFEKTTGLFVGGAGLIYLGYDDTQPEIEVGYALQKAYWRKGYATELTKALIQWGFTHLPIAKILGVTHPDNLYSRRVLENAGMSFLKYGKYHGVNVIFHAINNKKLDFTHVQLVPASLQDYPIIQNMARFYVYDMSEYLGHEKGWELPNDGLYECVDFKKYWLEENCFPFLIKVASELAGFVIVDKKGSDETIDFNMAQFFILRKFKNRGLGRYIAHQCFDRFKGDWEVMVIPGNDGAYQFWSAIIRDYTDNKCVEYTRSIAHFENTEKNIFRFTSRKSRPINTPIAEEL